MQERRQLENAGVKEHSLIVGAAHDGKTEKKLARTGSAGDRKGRKG